MFENNKKRYLTRGVDLQIPLDLQVFLWQCIDTMPEQKDYLQVFKLTVENGLQIIEHSSEQPEFHMEYILAEIENPITAKIYVIDDEEHCTMLLAEEY